jgi:hypothetical protein
VTWVREKSLKKGTKIRLKAGPRAGDLGVVEYPDGAQWAYVRMHDDELRKERFRNMEEI